MLFNTQQIQVIETVYEVGLLIKLYQRGCSLVRAAVLHKDKNKTTGRESERAGREDQG